MASGTPLVPAMPEAPVAMDVMWRQSAQNAILDYVLRNDPALAAMMQRAKPILAAKGISIVDGTASNSTLSSSFHTKLEALFPSDASDPNDALAIARLGGDVKVAGRLKHLFSYLHTWELFQRANVALVEVLRKPSKGAAVLADDLIQAVKTGTKKNKLKKFLPIDDSTPAKEMPMDWKADYEAAMTTGSDAEFFMDADASKTQTTVAGIASDFYKKFLAVFYCRPLATHKSADPAKPPTARPDAPVELGPDITLTPYIAESMFKARLSGNIPPIYLPLIALRSVVLFCIKVYEGQKVLVADESGKVVCPIGEQVAIYFGKDEASAAEVRDPALRAKLVELLRVHGQIKNVYVRCTQDFADYTKAQQLDLQPLNKAMFDTPF
jgi:hypothetical protein